MRFPARAPVTQRVHDVAEAAVRGVRSPRSLTWLLVALALPTGLSVQLGGLRLSPYRMVLMCAFFPLLARFFARTGPRRNAVDYMVALAAVWACMAIVVNEGAARGVEAGGILFVELFGAYLVGRVAITNADEHESFLRTMAVVITGVAVPALIEAVTGIRVVHGIVGALTGYRPAMEVEGRLGLTRAYGAFDHPILNGAFCGAVMAMLVCSASPSVRRQSWGSIGGALSALSSACFMAVGLQAAILTYDRLLRRFRQRWLMVGLGLLAAYVLISTLSNRSGLRAVLWYVTLDRNTAAYRLAIWEYGIENVRGAPLFGVGAGNWERPTWMPESVDAFWLQLALLYGLPVSLLLLVSTVVSVRRAARGSSASAAEQRARRGFAVSLAALAFVGFTVHYWNNVFVLFAFLLGAGGWLVTPRRSGEVIGK